MSSEEFTPIEKNGNYWLSKSNTAYHIINPNATSLTLIESDGYYSLARGGDTFYVLDANGNSTSWMTGDIRLTGFCPWNPHTLQHVGVLLRLKLIPGPMLGGAALRSGGMSPAVYCPNNNNGYSVEYYGSIRDQSDVINLLG